MKIRKVEVEIFFKRDKKRKRKNNWKQKEKRTKDYYR